MKKNIRIALISGAAAVVMAGGTTAGLLLTSGSAPVSCQARERAANPSLTAAQVQALCTPAASPAAVVSTYNPNPAVCARFSDQLQMIRNLDSSTASLADIVEISSGFRADETAATGQLHTDLAALNDQVSLAISSGGTLGEGTAILQRIITDCATS